jgi:hypothetical protein
VQDQAEVESPTVELNVAAVVRKTIDANQRNHSAVYYCQLRDSLLAHHHRL